MIKKLTRDKHKQPFKGFFTATRVQPSDIFDEETTDPAFGPLAIIDHAVMKKGLTIKMHEHKNDEILSYVWKGTSYHRDSKGYEVPISAGKLMMMNAGSSFWHEEKVKLHDEEDVEMLQIFVRPRESNLEPLIQFHEKETDNRNWYLMVGPENSEAPLIVRQNTYIFDAHPKKGDRLDIPKIEDYLPFLYVMRGTIGVKNTIVQKFEAVTDLEAPLPPFETIEDAVVLLFLVDMDAPMSMAGSISGMKKI